MVEMGIGIPVSYTHLDVYKRQAINGTSSLSDDPADQEHTMAPVFDTIIDHIPAPVDNSEAVSYTHLLP